MPLRRETARDDELVRYLLGDLPEDDAERLDERSIVDDEFAARLQAVEGDLLDDYARGRLSGERLQRFEAFYLTSPRRRDQAAFARRLAATIDGEARRGSASESGVLPASWTRWALAAAALLCLGTSALLLRDARLGDRLLDADRRTAAAEQQVAMLSSQLSAERRASAAAALAPGPAPAPSSASAVALVLRPQTRGTDPVPIIAVGTDASTVSIALTIEGAARKTYEAALKDPSTSRIVWRSPPLRTDGTPFVTVALPARLLKAQHYVVDTFGGPGAHDFVGSYAFEVVRP